MFKFEKHIKKENGLSFSLCCSYGKVKLPRLEDPPEELKKLYQDDRQFRDNIRQYNNLVSMASRNITGKKTDFSKSKGPSIFKITGEMYHLTSNLFPERGEKPKFSQIYTYDKEQELSYRLEHAKGDGKVNEGTLSRIQNELKTVNFYVKQFQSAAEVFKSNPSKDFKVVFKAKGSEASQKRHFKPDISDVVIIAPGDQTEPRDVVLYKSKTQHPGGNDTVRINEFNKMYDPAAYPLLLPFGDDGYSLPAPVKTNNKTLTAVEFYRYHFMVRNNSFNTLHKAK
jgi:hypothetical protein